MRAGQDLRAKALYALEEATHDCRYGKVRRTYALRLALAYLWSLDGGDRIPYRDFWSALDDWNSLTRYSDADRALLLIHGRLGVARDEEQYWALWASAQAEAKRDRASRRDKVR